MRFCLVFAIFCCSVCLRLDVPVMGLVVSGELGVVDFTMVLTCVGWVYCSQGMCYLGFFFGFISCIL